MSEPGTSILLVDDNEAKRYAAAEVLRRAGFAVIEAATGAEALSRAYEEPGLVILDVKLPDLDGFEVARRLRQTPAANAPVLHLSATFVRSEHQAKGLDSGAVGYLTYPIEPAVLIAQARSLLRLSRAERERARLLDRERIARAQAERSRARFRFLADLGRLLTATHRPTQMLREALEFLVPSQVDGAAIILALEGPQRVLVRHADPMREPAFAAWVERGGDSLLLASELRDETTGRPLTFEDGSTTGGAGPGARGEGGDGTGAVRTSSGAYVRDVLLLPIRYADELEGALLLLRRGAATSQGDEELIFFKEISGRLGSALASAHVFVVAERERERAEAANAAKDRFVATISHELRTPLTAQLTWLDILRRGENDPKRVAKALEVIERNARLQLQLIDDLLDLSRSIAGKLRVVYQAVDLLGVVNAAADGLRGDAEKAEITLTLPEQELGPVWMVGDPGRLQQIVTNLISNAIRYSPSGTTVEVTLEVEDERLVLSVIDQGRGIDPGNLERMFDPFWQGALEEGGHGSVGLGLGLPIVHSLVEQHHGEVRAFSEGLGRGTTLRVTLPRTLRRDAPAGDPAPAPTSQ